jgi:hypothetical protein
MQALRNVRTVNAPSLSRICATCRSLSLKAGALPPIGHAPWRLPVLPSSVPRSAVKADKCQLGDAASTLANLSPSTGRPERILALCRTAPLTAFRCRVALDPPGQLRRGATSTVAGAIQSTATISGEKTPARQHSIKYDNDSHGAAPVRMLAKRRNRRCSWSQTVSSSKFLARHILLRTPEARQQGERKHSSPALIAS